MKKLEKREANYLWYQKRVDQVTPNSNLWKDIPMAFLFGGLFSVLGEALSKLYMGWGLEQEAASAWVSVSLIFLGALLTALGVYDIIGRFAGAGSVVPISGFANSIVSPAIEFKKEGFVMGVGARMFTIAGPVLVYGVSASVLVGLIYWIWGL